jgi:hypothetical protein
MMRIYIESTIPSYLVARPARDLIQAARQQVTKDWWDICRIRHELYTSQVVLDEIAVGEQAMAELRMASLKGIPLLQIAAEAMELADHILVSGLLPKTADRDAAHIALASVYNLDILLSWNYRHIANAAIQSRLRRLVSDNGFELPVICTPDEMMESEHEDN